MTNGEGAQSATLRRIQRRRKLASIRKTLLASAFVAAALVSYCTLGRLPSVSELKEFAERATTQVIQPEPSDVAAATPETTAAEEVPPPAIPVDQSDPMVRQLARSVSTRPEVASWLAEDDLIRRLAASVANVSEGLSPRKQLEFMAPQAPFQVVEREEKILADPRNAARYDGLAEVVASLDVDTVTTIYRRLRPLLYRAYADLGYPDTDFDAALTIALEELWDTPIRDGEIELVPAGVGYQYADPALEGLSGAQKQLLRMGSRNQRLVRRQLATIAHELGLAEFSEPAGIEMPATAAQE